MKNTIKVSFSFKNRFQIILCQVKRKKPRKEIDSNHETSTFLWYTETILAIFKHYDKAGNCTDFLIVSFSEHASVSGFVAPLLLAKPGN